METLLSAPTNFLDALEKELIDSGMAEAAEEGDDAAGARSFIAGLRQRPRHPHSLALR